MREELAGDSVDGELLAELEQGLRELEHELERGEERRYFSGKYDDGGAIMTIHPGAGGTESQDWAEMLLRMYLRWFERRGFKVEINDVQEGDEAGLKSATLTVEGENVYGLLQSEKGVHRLVRMSPFDSANRRHTSFAAVEIIAARLGRRRGRDRRGRPAHRHLSLERRRRPARQQDELGGAHHAHPDQHRRAMPERALAAAEQAPWPCTCSSRKLVELEERKLADELARERGEVRDVNFGSQIRSYVLQPYQMVKDLRTGYRGRQRARRARRRPRRLRARLSGLAGRTSTTTAT